MTKPNEEKKLVSPLKRLLIRADFEALVDFLHSTRASWGISRPSRMNDRKQSAAYRARIQVPGHVEHAASGDTAKGALANAIASFLTHEQGDFHELLAIGSD